MLSQQERNRVFSQINEMKARIGQINAEIGQRRNQIESLKDSKSETRDLHRMFSKENARRERLANRGNYVRTDDGNVGVINTERAMFNIQSRIDQLYREIDSLFQEKSRLFAQKNELYDRMQAR
jgi:regulator of replication initiation timing